ncbi:hypothetical protein ACFVVU_10280 [Kitasatospora sp. NPDC057965]|uniref:hypothetical protein n=1 Tax=Kitasatospora sp. NPDC057965 TaxID=3346291 RepID=UPI0036D8AF78
MTATAYVEFVRRAYGSLERPTYHAILKLLERDPYRSLRSEFPPSWSVEDVTDENDDVGSVWRITWGGGGTLLRLSMIGPYATAFRLHSAGYATGECVFPPATEGEGAAGREEERRLADIVRGAGFALLSRAELDRTVPLRLANADEPVTLYEALFSYA